MSHNRGWAVFAENDEAIVPTVTYSRRRAITLWVGNTATKAERDAKWKRARRHGYSVRPVIVLEDHGPAEVAALRRELDR